MKSQRCQLLEKLSGAFLVWAEEKNPNHNPVNDQYFCYIVECSDGTYYTGWSTDPSRREKQHNSGNGAKYTRLHGPVNLVYIEVCPDRSAAMRREYQIKKKSHQQKRQLINLYTEEKNMPSNQKAFKYLSVAPGRVNLLGEHIDYNDGAVLPAAIDRNVRLSANPISGNIVHLKAIDLKEKISFSLDQLDQKVDLDGNPLPAWARYPAGVAWAARQKGMPVQAINGEYTSNVPIGAGLSSSAAVEVAFGALWQKLGAWTLSRLELAQLCQESENKYVGVNCGLMDQFASANGINGNCVYFDTRSHLSYPVPLPKGSVLIIANSCVQRSLSSSAYNQRRASCEQAVSILKSYLPDIKALRDVSPEDFQKYEHFLPQEVRKRARHVVYECDRVDQAVAYLRENNAKAFGKLMFECHASLRDDYEVSIPELDTLVDIAAKLEGCIGSRLTGAGFGGCTVSLVSEANSEQFIQELATRYFEKTGIHPEVYLCQASQGVEVFETGL